MKEPQNRQTHNSLFDVLRPVINLDARRLVVLVALVLAVIDRRTSVLYQSPKIRLRSAEFSERSEE